MKLASGYLTKARSSWRDVETEVAEPSVHTEEEQKQSWRIPAPTLLRVSRLRVSTIPLRQNVEAGNGDLGKGVRDKLTLVCFLEFRIFDHRSGHQMECAVFSSA